MVVVVVYHVTIVSIGHGLLKKCWPFGTRLRSAENSLADPINTHNFRIFCIKEQD